MPYVQRNEDEKIVARFANLQPGVAEEWIDEGSPELTVVPKDERINALQAEYARDRDRLNKAWLAALIADGVDEVARQSLIVSQMTALDEQLEADIIAILMEE